MTQMTEVTQIGRRTLLAGAAALGLAAPALAQGTAGQGLLKRLQAAKKVRVGIANQVPFSSLNPDGTLTGAAPTISKTILERLGITQIEGFVASYGELIPGMMAGRWDFVSASLTITKPRCGQVLYADPFTIDGSALYYKKTAPAKPQSIADVAKLGATIGSQAGGADYRELLSGGVAQSNILQFTSDLSLIDGLLADRMPYATTANSALKAVLQQRKITDLTIVYPVPDNPPKGSSCAFRQTDTDLHDAYQTELRKMKASGEFLAIMKQFSFEPSPDVLAATSEKMCETARG